MPRRHGALPGEFVARVVERPGQTVDWLRKNATSMVPQIGSGGNELEAAWEMSVTMTGCVARQGS